MCFNVVAICGIETVRDNNGTVLKTSDTFRNNIRTWEKDHPNFKVVVVDARDHIHAVDPISSLWLEVQNAFLHDKHEPCIDKLLYSGHSDTDILYVFSHVRMELPNEMRVLSGDFNWADAPYGKSAEIKLMGCQAGGQRGKKFTECIAQRVSDKTRKTVYAFVSRSSQRKRADGGYVQTPDIGGYVKFTPNKVDKADAPV